MVNSKKLLSLFLAVVMVFSALTVMASAYTRVETEGTADIDVKYTVEKVATVPETAAGSAEWSADNIYAVTVWMKSAKPVDMFTVPFHYNKTLFSPITLSDGECTYPYGAGMDQDTYYTDMTEGAIYAYTLGDYMNNTGMYKANGTTATTKALAKCIGLGNANSDGVTVITELVSPDHPNYTKWGAGLPENTGVVYANLDVSAGTKTAYLNTIEGIETYTDWIRMFTVYFEAIADDVTGAEFGVFTDDCFTVDGNYDGTGSAYFVSATSYQALVPTMNIVSNAVVEAAAGPTVEAMGTMARMDDWTAAESTNIFDGGLIGQISNVTLTFTEDKQCNEIESIEVYANGQKMGNAYQVYKVDDTTYQFRAVVKNMDKTADTYATDVEYEFRVTMKGDYASLGTLTATKTVSAQTIFNTAYAKYQAANA